MLTKFTIRRFKKLGGRVVLVGPNNSGKTTFLQAITTWDVGLRKWAENRLDSRAEKRTGVTINRTDLLSSPLPNAVLLWNQMHTRDTKTIDGKRDTQNVRFELIAEGVTENTRWEVGFAFDYANPESFYCRFITNGQDFPRIVLKERIGFLPPMSGLAVVEERQLKEVLNSRIGEGRTAEILRNLLLSLYENDRAQWEVLRARIENLFMAKLDPPIFNTAKGTITVTYRESAGKSLDLSSAGRGFQQMLLLLAYMYSSKNSVLLLDEPDAHLEILRQKSVYDFLTKASHDTGTQLIIATHSETVLNQAIEKDQVVAFIGKPWTVVESKEVIKSLRDIDFTHYILAKQNGWVLYLEGETDLDMLRAFAEVLDHPVREYLERPFMKPLGNNKPGGARNHYKGLGAAVANLKGIALFDSIATTLNEVEGLTEVMWKRREIENYLPLPVVLERWGSERVAESDLFTSHDRELLLSLFIDAVPPAAIKDKAHVWWTSTKMSDDILDPLFKLYFEKIGGYVSMDKSRYYRLASLARPEELVPEVAEKLDAIYELARSVKRASA
jgi:ABC-type transport system involved in cytochrome c biogenesis ATPase subunit